MSESDAQLVERCLEAKEAFGELYQRHAPSLFAYLRSLNLGDEHAAADLLQETFVKAYEALPRFDRGRPLRPWLYTIATRTSLDRQRRESRGPAATEPALIGARASAGGDPVDAATTRDAFSRLVAAAGDRLSPRKVAAYLMARGHGFTYQEIAEVHGCSLVTVKRDLSEALVAFAGAARELGLVEAS